MEVLFERGRKRVAVAPLSYWLTHLHVPLFQRPEQRHHTAAITEALAAAVRKTGDIDLPGIITVALTHDGITIVDGQHRVAALRRLVQDLPALGTSLLEVALHTCDTPDAVFELYRQVNSSIPVPLTETETESIHRTELRQELEALYPLFLKSTARPRAPSFNLDTFLKHYNDFGAWKALGEPTARAVIDALARYDAYLSSVPPSTRLEWGLPADTYATYWHWYSNGEWVPRLIASQTLPFEHMSHARHGAGARKLPILLRRKVWEKRFPSVLMGTCVCCDNALSYDAFESGHVVARCLGGADHVDNLEPICATCNRDMGIENLMSYRARLQNGK